MSTHDPVTTPLDNAPNVISDDEDDDLPTTVTTVVPTTQSEGARTATVNHINSEEPPPAHPLHIDFHDMDAHEAPNSSHGTSATQELLRWHYRLQLMARKGLLPKQIARCHVPKCQDCVYGKQTRRPWRTRSTAGSISLILPYYRTRPMHFYRSNGISCPRANRTT